MSALTKPMLLLSLLLCSIVSGCLNNDDSQDSPVQLVVYYDQTAGTIYENWTNGQRISQTGVTFSFDFARTTSTSGDIEMFTLLPGDGSAVIEVMSSDSATIEYEYNTHGLFTAILGAQDVNGNTANMSLYLRVDAFTNWIEQNSENPITMEINAVPDCEECSGPTLISIDSEISNPNNLIPATGSTNTVTWNLVDPNDEVKATKTEQIAEGQTKLWEHDQLGVTSGTWELNVQIDSGEDNINITHEVSIRYEEDESEPHPFE